jgi:GrpB-like predicted nucleotidyltransferase (UPF0157 family)
VSRASPCALHRAPIEIVPCSTHWPGRFAGERAVLATGFPDDTLIIEHIGSTAVPGLDAKPIVDPPERA